MSAATRKSSRRSVRTPGWRAPEEGVDVHGSSNTRTATPLGGENISATTLGTRSSSRARRPPALYDGVASHIDADTPTRGGMGAPSTTKRRLATDKSIADAKKKRVRSDAGPATASTTLAAGKSPRRSAGNRAGNSASPSSRVAAAAAAELAPPKTRSTINVTDSITGSTSSAPEMKQQSKGKGAAAPASTHRHQLSAGASTAGAAAPAAAGEAATKITREKQPPLYSADSDGPADFMTMLRAAAYTLKTPIGTPHGSPKSYKRSPNDKWAGVVLPNGIKMKHITEDDETEGAASSVTAEAAETDEAAAAEDGTAGVGKKRKFHNLRERQRRFLIRDLFISLRDAIPELAARDSVADREILVEARATIKELEEQSELLQQKLEEQRRRSADLMAARTAATAKRNGGGSDASSGSTSPAPSTSDYGSEDAGQQSENALPKTTAIVAAETQLAEVLVMLAAQ